MTAERQDAGRIRFVLVRPSVPGNIGATARAMKTMGHHHLWLVSPDTEFPHREATRRAVEAADVLAQATVVDTLAEALAGCQLSVAVSARRRHADWPILSPGELRERVSSVEGELALVFGPESSGLSNEELYQCRLQTIIASNPRCPSLNLSHAVQIYAWELAGHFDHQPTDRVERPTQEQLDHLLGEVDKLLEALDFAPAGLEDPRLAAVLQRADLKLADWSLLEGVLRRALQRLSTPATGDEI
ncbi:MAG: RNA methyltransferase [Pseudomonadota bacterium]